MNISSYQGGITMKKHIGLSLLSTLAFANTVTIDGEPKQEKYQSVDKIIIKHADLKIKIW